MMKSFIAIFIIFLFNYTTTLAGNYTWNGGTSTAWGTSTNWTPNGVPSTNDTVTIVTGSNNVYLAAATTVKVMTMTSGTMDLQSYTLTITSTCNFNSGTINNGRLTAYGTAVLTFKGTQFGAKVTATGNSILLNGSVFSDSLFVIKKGSSNDNGKGGNTFNGVVQLVDSGTGSIVLADSFPDTFNSTLSIRNTSTGTVYIAHRATGTQFNGDVTFSGSNVYSNYYGTATYSGNIILDRETGNMFFGTSTGSCTQVHGKKISISSKGISSGRIGLRNFTSLDSSSAINLTVTGSARLYFWEGSTFHDTIIASAPHILLNGTKFRNVTSFTSTTGGIASNGGCYFAKSMTFVGNSSTSALIALASTNADTFALSSYFENTKGTLTMNKGLFYGKTTIKNNSTTGEGFFIASTGSCTFKDTLYIYKFGSLGVRFGSSGGTTLLDSNSVFITEPGAEGVAFMQNVTKLSVSSLTMEESPSELTLTSGNNFNGNFYFHGKSVASTGSTFNATATLKMHPTANVTFGGSNTFNGTAIIQDSSSTAHNTYLANSTADDYNSDVTFIQKGTSVNLYPAYTKNSTFSGNITTDGSSSMQLGGNGGKVILDGTTAQSINRGTSSLYPTIKKLQVNKASNSLTLNTPLIVSDSLQLTKGRINTDTTNLLSISHGGKLIGGSDSTYINGPLKKTGNAAFTFAVGSSSLTHPYHPIEITAPTTSTDAYTAHYFPTIQTLGTAIDSTIDNLNACQYWNLIRNEGTSKVKVKLSWNNDSCETISPSNFRVTGWNGSMWEDLGNAATSGDSIVGTVQSEDSLNSINTLTLAFLKCSSFRKTILQSNVSCKGSNDGEVDLEVKGGTKTYSYNWSNNAGNNFKAKGLSSGIYTFNILDIRGCLIFDSVIVAEPDSITISFSVNNPSCNTNDGKIISLISGGTAPYDYYWLNTGDTISQLENLTAGEYALSISDLNGCMLNKSYYLEDSNGPGMNIITLINNKCSESDSGSVEIIGSDSYSPYSYLWSTSSIDTLPQLNDLSAGEYTVRITNKIGCISYESIEITEPDPIEISVTKSNSMCSQSVGDALATVSGGTYPYTYNWIPLSLTTQSIDSLMAGTYTVNVTDSLGCAQNRTIEILDENGPVFVPTVLSNVHCAGDSSGIVFVQIDSAASPYFIYYNDILATSDTITNLLEGDYKITVVDSSGCIQQSSIGVDAISYINIDFNYFLPTGGSSYNGQIVTYVEGGVPPYSYSWSSGASTQNLSGLNSLCDTLTVTDSYGCQSTKRAYISTGQRCIDCTDNPINNCTYPVINWAGGSTCTLNIVDDFGAIPSDGGYDECAFEAAANFFNSIGADVIKVLEIPSGTYEIGRQDNLGYTYLKGVNVMCFQFINNLTIKGITGDYPGRPVLKNIDCLKYGAFDVLNGNPQNRLLIVEKSQYVLAGNIASVGSMISFNHCKNINIENLELHGNEQNTIVGGGIYADGIQESFDGIYLNATSNFILDNLYIHHFGHDGIWVREDFCSELSQPRKTPKMNGKINNVVVEFSGRNNMSWTSGKGLLVTNSHFNYASQGRIASKMYAGVDIELESNYEIRALTFINCVFKYNGGFGLINDADAFGVAWKSRDFLFQNDTIVGSEFGVAMHINSSKFRINRSFIHGLSQAFYNRAFGTFAAAASNFDQAILTDCFFSDEFNDPTIGGNHSFQGSVPESNGGVAIGGCPVPVHNYLITCLASRTEFNNCDIHSNFTTKPIYWHAARAGQRWNHIQGIDVWMYSHGLNGCGCDWDLTSIYHVLWTGNNAMFVPLLNLFATGPGIYLRNQGTANCSALSVPYYTATSIAEIIPQGNFFNHQIQHVFADPTPIPDKFAWPLALNRVPYYYSQTQSTMTEYAWTPICHELRLRKPGVIENEFESDNFIFFPNPVSDMLYIEKLPDNCEVKILNISGQQMMGFYGQSKEMQINISNLDDGIYIVEVANHLRKKLIKISR